MLKAGQIVSVNDPVGIVRRLPNGTLVSAPHDDVCTSLHRVVATDQTLPSHKIGTHEMFNDTIIEALDDGRITFIHSRFLQPTNHIKDNLALLSMLDDLLDEMSFEAEIRAELAAAGSPTDAQILATINAIGSKLNDIISHFSPNIEETGGVLGKVTLSDDKGTSPMNDSNPLLGLLDMLEEMGRNLNGGNLYITKAG